MEKYSNNDDSKQSRAMMSAFRIELIFRFMTPLSSRDRSRQVTHCLFISRCKGLTIYYFTQGVDKKVQRWNKYKEQCKRLHYSKNTEKLT